MKLQVRRMKGGVRPSGFSFFFLFLFLFSGAQNLFFFGPQLLHYFLKHFFQKDQLFEPSRGSFGFFSMICF